MDWQLTDEIVNWLSKTGRIIKGHPLVWLHKQALAEWMTDYLTFDEFKEFLVQHIIQVVNRYKNRIKIWDIVPISLPPFYACRGFLATLEMTV